MRIDIFSSKNSLFYPAKSDIPFCFTYPPTYIPLYPIFTNLSTYPKIGYPLWTAPKLKLLLAEAKVERHLAYLEQDKLRRVHAEKHSNCYTKKSRHARPRGPAGWGT